MHRRNFLKCCAAGGLGLYPALSLAAELNGGAALAPKPAHFVPKAKNLIVVYLTGGFSHVDTFDPKPKLKIDHGKKVYDRELRDVRRLDQFAIRHIAPHISRERLNAAKAVAPQERAVAEQIERPIGLAIAVAQHRQHELMVR